MARLFRELRYRTEDSRTRDRRVVAHQGAAALPLRRPHPRSPTRANQLRLWFASVAYVLLNFLRHFGLRGSEVKRAQAGTIRMKLLKLGALVRISVRRGVRSLCAGALVRDLFARVALALWIAPA